MNIIIQGIILGLSITAPFGPTNIEIIRRGVKEGPKGAISFWLGVMVALFIYLLLVVFGLSLLLHSYTFNILLTSFGVIVLAYLSYNSLREFFSGREIKLEEPSSRGKNFIPGIVLTITNPAVLLMWTGIMGANLSTNRTTASQGLLLSLGIMIGVAIFFSLLTIIIYYGRRFLQQKILKYVSLVAGIVLLIFFIMFAHNLICQLL
jgi:threonine/homoserine/homoserine lactone efflux protein